MIKRKIKNSDEMWNAFIDLIAMEDYDDLSELQKIAHLCFWYDSEIANGGHLQYLLNRGIKLIPKTVKALKILGANRQGEILEEVESIVKKEGLKKIETVEKYCEEALEGRFDKYDTDYYESTPEITELLEKYLEKHSKEFVDIIE
ncbi:MAG TPA: DUF4375 domain-containing protein [Planctomycetota bacterium]|nr:DUF4375 domain-containing protein [Planctomycetota bacterium]